MSAKKIKPAQLRDAFKADLVACWQHAWSLHPKETPYAFALHGLEGTPHLYPYVLTEEGLAQVAERYVRNGHHETLKEARKSLRYSMEDSPYAGELEDKFPTVDALVEPIEHLLDETEGYAVLAKAAMDAFEALDRKGVFGKGRRREKLLLMIDTRLAEKDWSKPSIKRLNSNKAFRRYEAETKLDGPFATSNALVASPDGRVLYFECSRASVSEKDPDIDEIVACDVMGLRLKRRWSISLQSRSGESTPFLACSADGVLFALRRKYFRGSCTVTVQRFAPGTKKLLSQIELVGEPGNLAVSADGSQVVVGMSDRMVCWFKDELKVTECRKLKQELWPLQFVGPRELLGVCKKGFFSVDAEFRVKSSLAIRNAYILSMDEGRKLCAVKKRKDEFGFQVFRYPEWKLVRSIRTPGHELRGAVLSRDGKLAACEVMKCGQYSTSVMVFEVKSGREIARRKAVDVNQMVFLPGNEVLAISTYGFMKSEPVILWRFR